MRPPMRPVDGRRQQRGNQQQTDDGDDVHASACNRRAHGVDGRFAGRQHDRPVIGLRNAV